MSDVRSDDLMAALRLRYAAPQWALVEQVRSAPGFSALRTADAVAVGLWESTGCVWEGFELKVSRSDWLREARQAAKAEPFLDKLHRFWLVVPPGVAQLGEVPTSWGMLELFGNRLRIKKAAPQLLHGAQWQPGLKFVSAVMRRVWEGAPAEAAVQAREEAAQAKGVAEGSARQRPLEGRLRALEANLKAFEDLTGIRIDEYQPPERHAERFAQLVRWSAEAEMLMRTVRMIHHQLTDALPGLAEAATTLQSLMCPTDKKADPGAAG